MKITLSFIVLFLSVLVAHGQVISVDNLFILGSLSRSKADHFLYRNGFAAKGKSIQNDTVLSMYEYRTARSFKDRDSISISITRADIKEESYIIYETTSAFEFGNLKTALKNGGFYCNLKDGGDHPFSLLYQNKDLSVRTAIKTDNGTTRYSLLFYKKKFPRAKDIYYADDLLTFTSHEYLAYYFGEKNVRKDIFFLSENEITKCSVLFLNTNRQVVFIWADEDNQCTISRILLGGQQNLKSALESGKYIRENNWALKSGLRPGMSLQELRMLNGNNFSFYGGNSGNSGSVIPDNRGKIDFKNEQIILSCLNCRDDKFNIARVVNADESIEEGRILFILSIVLHPL